MKLLNHFAIPKYSSCYATVCLLGSGSVMLCVQQRGSSSMHECAFIYAQKDVAVYTLYIGMYVYWGMLF